MKNYPVKVQQCKNGAFIAQINNEKGETLKEIYFHHPQFNEKVNMGLLQKYVKYLVSMDIVDDK